PGFVVLLSTGKGGMMQPIAARQWSAGMLPSKFQGVKLNSVGDPVLHIQNPPGVNGQVQQNTIEAVNRLNREQFAAVSDPEVITRISQYERGCWMKASVPE